jgi:hypothetical protein
MNPWSWYRRLPTPVQMILELGVIAVIAAVILVTA